MVEEYHLASAVLWYPRWLEQPRETWEALPFLHSRMDFSTFEAIMDEVRRTSPSTPTTRAEPTKLSLPCSISEAAMPLVKSLQLDSVEDARA